MDFYLTSKWIFDGILARKIEEIFPRKPKGS
jgi:hypothetical protein